MRLVILSVIIMVGCKTIDIDDFYLMRMREVDELNESINNYRIGNGNWPSDKEIDSFKLTNRYLKRFSRIAVQPISDSSLNVSFNLQYNDFEDPIQSLDVSEVLKRDKRDSCRAYRYRVNFHLNNLVLQNNIQLGARTKLTPEEKKKFRERERLRKAYRQLVIENTATKERVNLKIGSRINIYSRDSSLVMDNWTWPEEYGYKRAEWFLTTINASDSTINIDTAHGGFLRRLVKFDEIDSIGVKSKHGVFKIVRVNDTAHNKS